MTDSILDETKHALGVGADYDVFDPDLVMHINASFFTLSQVGVGPVTGYQITGDQEKWTDFITDPMMISGVKSYVYARVRLLFDPPQTSFGINALEEQAKEYLWRLNVQAEGSP